MSRISTIALPLLSAVLTAGTSGLSSCESTGSTPAPLHKGDPGAPPASPPTEMAPNPRSNGQWMVKAIRTDGPGDYSVMCWINSDESTITQVFITPSRYEEYMDNPDTGSIPCPAVPR